MGVGRRARIRRHPRVQREGAAERTTIEHGLRVPANQRNDDSIQDRGYCCLSGIATGRRWPQKAESSTEARTWPTPQILYLTVSTTLDPNGVEAKFAVCAFSKTAR